jgi:hypothetical protein
MRKAVVLAHYGNNQSAVARALKITRASVNAWPDLIPELSARRLQEITRGKLRFNSSLYDKAKEPKSSAVGATA